MVSPGTYIFEINLIVNSLLVNTWCVIYVFLSLDLLSFLIETCYTDIPSVLTRNYKKVCFKYNSQNDECLFNMEDCITIN